MAEDGEKMAVEFVRHIRAHLKAGEVVVCKICDKSIFEIWGEKEECPHNHTQGEQNGTWCTDCGKVLVDRTGTVGEHMKWDTYQKFMELLEDVWNTDYGAYSVENGMIGIHTGGWSENEEVLPRLRDTFYWFIAWQRLERGGHYYLKVIDFEKKEE